MENLPSELWTSIFALACTDGGLTGCAISLVSRYFRLAVLPVQLHSVALVSTKQTTKFADIVEAKAPEECRVRHLFISRLGEGGTSRVPAYAHSAVSECLYRILRAVSSTLETLTSTLTQGHLSHDKILSITFPRLTELTVHGYVLYPDAEAEAGLKGSFPTLRFLHILSSCDSVALHIRRAPLLTNLRLSSVATMGSELRRALLDFLSGEDHATTSPLAFPPTLQRIIVERHHNRLARYMTHGNPSAFNSATRHALENADKGRKLLIIDDDRRGDGSSFPSHNVRRDWEDRVLGGQGCWVEERAGIDASG